MTYLTHPRHGATDVFETGEVDRLTAMGWTVTEKPTGAQILAQKKAAIKDRLKAELAALEEVPEEAPKAESKPKRKYNRKAVAA